MKVSLPFWSPAPAATSKAGSAVTFIFLDGLEVGAP